MNDFVQFVEERWIKQERDDYNHLFDVVIGYVHRFKVAIQSTPEQTNDGNDGIEEGGAFDQWNAKDKAEGAKLHGADYTIWSNTRTLRAWQAALAYAGKCG